MLARASPCIHLCSLWPKVLQPVRPTPCGRFTSSLTASCVLVDLKGGSMEQLQFGQMPAAQPSLRVLRETPAVRVTQSGAKNVALVELLGAVIGDADTALRVLATYPSIEDLCRAPATDLSRIKGLGSN